MQTDPIGDMLTIIRNGYMVGKKIVSAPHSKLKENIVKVLKEERFIEDYELTEKRGKPSILIYLLYRGKNTPAITEIRRVSKPGRRWYVAKKEIPNVRSGYGIAILSTNKGVMSSRRARKEGCGGELICEVW